MVNESKKKVVVISIISVIALIIGSIAVYSNVIKPKIYENQLNLDNSYLMEENYNEAIVDFEKPIEIDDNVSAMPSNLADSYLSRMKMIDMEMEGKLNSDDPELSCNAGMGQTIYEAQVKYESLVKEMYRDLELYLSSDKKSELEVDKANYKNSVAKQQYEFDNIDSEMVGTWMVQGIPEAFLGIAKNHCYDLINKYMK